MQTPVTAKPKRTCKAILDFYGAPTWRMDVPDLMRQTAASLADHGTKVLVLDFGDWSRWGETALIGCLADFVLLQMIEDLCKYPLTLRITRSYEHNADAVANDIATHRDIVQAASEGDPDRLAELVTAHWQGLTESLLRGREADEVTPRPDSQRFRPGHKGS
ncbi:hypothetical protein [Streptomyces sp. NBC_01445]|uniref:hypothetical protein n=1 Tax=Streptomyces sp. NBC_01445 TaxID=2903869 RepID=UPI002DDA2782|nr:hypothetical protein [Streptomyces sp. NBC_01445]WSE04004.1 hypothetical protein OG574_11910 [Streptomyces sp. NBC_01445]